MWNLNQNRIKISQFTQKLSKKFPLWSDFSKGALQIIFKMVFFSCGSNRFQQEVERRYFKWKSRPKKAPCFLLLRLPLRILDCAIKADISFYSTCTSIYSKWDLKFYRFYTKLVTIFNYWNERSSVDQLGRHRIEDLEELFVEKVMWSRHPVF